MNQEWSGGQYSLFRVLSGTVLFSLFTQTLITRPWRLSSAITEEQWPPLLFDLAVTTRLNLPLVILCLAVCLLFLLGQKDRLAAGFLLLPTAMYFPGFALFGGLHPFTVLLMLHMLTPSAPYASLAALNRTDPAGGWAMPSLLPAIAGTASFAGCLFLGLQLASMRGWLPLSSWVQTQQTWPLMPMAIGLVGGACLWGLVPLRKSLWWVLFTALPILSFFGSPSLLLGLWFLLILGGPPPWPKRVESTAPEHLFYDGSCGLCHRACRFVLAEDQQGMHFDIAPLFGPTFEELVDPARARELPDSMVIRETDGRIHVQAVAVLYMLERLGGYWRLLALLAKPIPTNWLSRLYGVIASYRHRWFAPPEEVCPLLPPHLRARFKP